MIAVSHLVKRYGAATAVDDVSFEIGKGEIVGFLGPNGAGKSTTLRILAGFLGPTAGTVSIAGHDVVREPLEARRCIGYMPEAVPLYPEMRVVEYLRFRAELKHVPGKQRASHIDVAMRRAGVVEVAHRRIGHLSKGYRQRVGLADAIVAAPPILILDEPTAGLDPNQIREARDVVRDLGREHTVVLSTHILGEVEACATRVLLLHRGKLVAAGTTDQLRALRSPPGVDLVVRGEGSRVDELLRGVEGIEEVDREAADRDAWRVRVRFATGGTDRALTTERCVSALVGGGCGVRQVRMAGTALEDVFAALTASDPETRVTDPKARDGERA